ncbi:sulfotransferase domain-containing protein [uncultured Roseobacter sp.]|uniref:sulfotransferase domain-containing protein n=1 Tax=uncultured Roseobacter sp. TaxID=114847 RepID=UPI00261D6E2E|nr:sulfotransferase domain-containing protein [uncultured Roseobacter sp.]
MNMVRTERQRDYSGPVTNTEIWDTFQLRTDDVIVSTPPKCGTTWTLNIVMMLIHGRVVPDAGNRNDAPWIDCAFRDRQALAAGQTALTRRRCLKSHTPMDGIAYGAEPTYFVVYRHPVDVHFSFRNHVANMKQPGVLQDMFPDDIREGFRRFVENPLTDTGTDDLTIASVAHHFLEARRLRDKGNVHFFHYADLTRDLHGQIARMAGLLEIDLSGDTLSAITKANTFASMRRVAEQSEKRFHEESPFKDMADFFASGTSNKWEGRLSDADIATYTDRCAELLSPEEACWLNWGERGTP